MTRVEIYAIALLVTPLVAALIACVVCWRDGHKTHLPRR